MSAPHFQYYWRCEHYPSAIDNFFGQKLLCEHHCQATPLRSTDLGFHPTLKSWSARRGTAALADQIFGV